MHAYMCMRVALILAAVPIIHACVCVCVAVRAEDTLIFGSCVYHRCMCVCVCVQRIHILACLMFGL
jgi:hypothetical protein